MTRVIRFRSLALASVAAVFAFGSLGCRSAQTTANGTTAAAPAAPNYLCSSPSSFQRLLPPPPAAGGPQEKCETQAILIAQAEVTPATRERVKQEETLAPAIFDQAAGRAISESGTPRTFALLKKALADTRIVSNQVKASWNRARPSTQEPRITLLVELPTNSSYPSGHATLAAVWSTLLAELAPGRRDDLERRARVIAWDRVVAGVHYPSDVAAGWVLGEALARNMLESPALQAELSAARAEWPTAR